LQRAVVTAVLIVSLHGYFDRTERELLVLTGFALLIWLPALRCLPAATVVAGVIAEASLYIYLTHYQVYPLLKGHPLLGVLASVVVGVLVTQLVSVLRRRLTLGDSGRMLVRRGRSHGPDSRAAHYRSVTRTGL
jgi:hypothetical protein